MNFFFIYFKIELCSSPSVLVRNHIRPDLSFKLCQNKFGLLLPIMSFLKRHTEDMILIQSIDTPSDTY